jgi:DNA replication protein DnaC
MDTLTQLRDTFETTSSLPNLFVIYGPAGSGKSALAKVFLRELYESANIDRGNVHKWIMQVRNCLSIYTY